MTQVAALSMSHVTAGSSPSPLGIYNSSVTPSDLPWDTYNYCNAPHVNAEHYTLPPTSGATLVYVNMIMRHHKRTPDNLYPNENALNPAAGWDCSDLLQLNFGGGTAPVYHTTDIPAWHPFRAQIWNGTCDAGQLTAGGLADAVRHGQDFWAVYHTKLGLLDAVDERELYVRTSNEARTQQVAGGLLFGMDPATAARGRRFPLHTQPSNIDSLVPSYSCPRADALRSACQAVPAWTAHLTQNAALQARLDATLGTAGLSAWSTWYDHFFDTFTARTCHGHPLPCNATGACVSAADAARVFALGDFEYNYIYNSAPNATEYVALSFGVLFRELAYNLRTYTLSASATDSGSGSEASTPKARVYVAHDGSLARLAGGLGLGLGLVAAAPAGLRWPALGSEVVFEVWEIPAAGKGKGTGEGRARFVRVLHEGAPVVRLAWVPLDDFVATLEGLAPPDLDLAARCADVVL